MSFTTRLEKVYDILDMEKQAKSETKLVLPKPNIEITTTNTFWHNVKDFLRKVNRPPGHFIDFLGDQLGTEVTKRTSSLSKGLIIRHKHPVHRILPLIEKYVKEYVLCKNCSSYCTKIKKDNDIRKYILTCKSCKSSYSV